MMGVAYGVIFFIVGLLLLHPTIGLANTTADPSRPLGWISYCAIESFGSMVVQCYWALVNDSVDTDFAKKHFGVIIAGAQIGSILGPTLATQASVIGIPTLYIGGSLIMFMMVGAMYFYVLNFCQEEEEEEEAAYETLSDEGFEEKETVITTTKVITTTTTKNPNSSSSSRNGKEEGIMEGFNLLYEHDYVKGIFAISSFSMVQVTVIDYMMKVLAMQRYTSMYPDDPQAALRAFATFMGYFGQTTNTISFLFSFFGTSLVIKHLGFSYTLLAYPAILLGCTVFVWTMPNIWVSMRFMFCEIVI
jgi:AAA family ATP:ADP antiporter